MKNKKSLMAVAGIVVVALAAGVIYQQTGNKTDKYPSRDINMVVPWNPGGSTDLTGRALADAMGKSMGTNIVVTNTPGSGGSVGSLTVQKAEKDGYNILANGMLALTAMPVLGYTETTQKDWDFYLATFTPNVLAVRKDSPYQTAQELLDAMKANPDSITDGTGGMGSGGHLGMRCFARRQDLHISMFLMRAAERQSRQPLQARLISPASCWLRCRICLFQET